MRVPKLNLISRSARQVVQFSFPFESSFQFRNSGNRFFCLNDDCSYLPPSWKPADFRKQRKMPPHLPPLPDESGRRFSSVFKSSSEDFLSCLFGFQCARGSCFLHFSAPYFLLSNTEAESLIFARKPRASPCACYRPLIAFIRDGTIDSRSSLPPFLRSYLQRKDRMPAAPLQRRKCSSRCQMY